MIKKKKKEKRWGVGGDGSKSHSRDEAVLNRHVTDNLAEKQF